MIKQEVFSRRALEDYIKAIYRLEEAYGVARTSDIAMELGVSPSTVSKTLRKLAEEGYVVWNPYEGVRLSSKGREFAVGIIRKHRIAEVFLFRELGFNIVEAHRYAHMLEHMPYEFFERLYIYLNRPQTCPHGNPVDPDKYRIMDRALNEFDVGERVCITRVLCSFREDIVIKLHELGVHIDTVVCIVGKDDGIKISKDGVTVRLTHHEASFIRGVGKGKCTEILQRFGPSS